MHWFPIIGSILLTAIIAYVLACTIYANRRKIGDALAGREFLTISDGNLLAPENRVSVCCGAPTFRPRWSADGWITSCQMCGQWQYLGDDHDNPPPDAITGVGNERYHRDWGGSKPEVTSKNFCPLCDAPLPGAHAFDCPRQIADEMMAMRDEGDMLVPQADLADDAREAARIAHHFGDDGDPLVTPPTPNIGGEGNPAYEGPHYDSLQYEPRFAPYEMLRDPPPGAAVYPEGEEDAAPHDIAADRE